jgi:transketolase
LIASGTELGLALEARTQLEAEAIPTRVVSMPSWYLFGREDAAYQDDVLPPEVAARVSVEAASTFGWERWLGHGGLAIGLDRFGASAPAEVLFERFGFTVGRVVAAARDVLAGAEALRLGRSRS